MDFLRVLEGIRTPLGENILYYLTFLGEETIILGIVGVVFWCFVKNVSFCCMECNFDVCDKYDQDHLPC